jgi:hypothetical protein
MLDRLVAMLLVWGLGGCLAWFVAHAYVGTIAGGLGQVSRALAAS